MTPISLLKTSWEYWKKIAHRIGTFQSRLILTLFYFTILLPVGIVFSLFKDALGIKAKRKSTWIAKVKQVETLEEMKEQ